MKLVFVSGLQILFNNELVSDIVDCKEQLCIIYFKNVELSYDYAGELAKNNNVCFFQDISIFFKNKQNDIYSFSFGEYTIHITKHNKNYDISFSPFQSNLESINAYILNNTKINDITWRFKNTSWNLNILLYIIDLLFWPIIFIITFIFGFLSYKIYYPNIDFNCKKLIYEMRLERYQECY